MNVELISVVDGISAVVIVFGMVEVLKKFKIDGNILILISLGIGVLTVFLFNLPLIIPGSELYVNIIVRGLVYGLGATGIYSYLSKRLPKL